MRSAESFLAGVFGVAAMFFIRCGELSARCEPILTELPSLAKRSYFAPPAIQ